jgi:hypothetical protein
MTADANESPVASPSPRPLRWLGPVLLLALFAGGTVVAVLGIGGSELPAPVAKAKASPVGPVASIEFPYEEMAIPPGPHQKRFRVACTVCHSPRLTFTQPPLTEKQWSAVVHKMVAVYGAPINPGEEKDVVAYLTAVRGK